MVPAANIIADAGGEVAVLEQRRRDERPPRGQHVHDEQVDTEAAEHRLDDDLARGEPVLVLAAIQHHLDAADAQAEHGEADPVEPHAGVRGSARGMKKISPSVARMPNGRLM